MEGNGGQEAAPVSEVILFAALGLCFRWFHAVLVRKDYFRNEHYKIFLIDIGGLWKTI
jgi:hypothetical protein